MREDRVRSLRGDEGEPHNHWCERRRLILSNHTTNRASLSQTVAIAWYDFKSEISSGIPKYSIYDLHSHALRPGPGPLAGAWAAWPNMRRAAHSFRRPPCLSTSWSTLFGNARQRQSTSSWAKKSLYSLPARGVRGQPDHSPQVEFCTRAAGRATLRSSSAGLLITKVDGGIKFVRP